MFRSVGKYKKTVGDYQLQPWPDSLVLSNTPILHTKSGFMSETWAFLPSFKSLEGINVDLKQGLHVWEFEKI